MKRITIIGGGLAGLTLGIGLRRRRVPVLVREAGHYPRHRVCGEFICGRGREVLRRLDLEEPFRRAGALEANTALLFPKIPQPVVMALPDPALCLSRFMMDALLASAFRELGGELHEGQREQSAADEPGKVFAAGRRRTDQSQWFGMKIHVQAAGLNADLELHAVANGYVGLCRLDGGLVNVCGLFRKSPVRKDHHDSRALLMGPPGTPLHQRLHSAEIVDSTFCSVAGCDLRPSRADPREGCRIGDALTMIPPFTGNGMSMAFEAAELALDPLCAYSHGLLAWDQAKNEIATRCNAAFRRRLLWSGLLHNLVLTPVLRETVGQCLLSFPRLRSKCFDLTR